MPSLPNTYDPLRDFTPRVVAETIWMTDLWTPREILPVPAPEVDCKTFVFIPLVPSMLTKVLCVYENIPELPQLGLA